MSQWSALATLPQTTMRLLIIMNLNTNPERIRNQRPTLVVPPNVSTSVKEIWIGNVLLLETFLVKFLPAPEPFRRKDAFTINKF